MRNDDKIGLPEPFVALAGQFAALGSRVLKLTDSKWAYKTRDWDDAFQTVFRSLFPLRGFLLITRMADISTPTIINSSDIQNLAEGAFSDSRCGNGITWKTLISSSKTPTNSMMAGIATCAAGETHLTSHRHSHAEVYHIIDGEGVMNIEGQEYSVTSGSVIFIPSNASHGVRNTSADRALRWLYVFAADDFSEIKYRFPHDEGGHSVRSNRL